MFEDREPLIKVDKVDQAGSEESLSINKSMVNVFSLTLPKLCRSSQKSRRLNTLLLEAINSLDLQEIERLVKAGANPNSTCGLNNVSACHLAALRSDDALSLLISYGADKDRSDRLGRTPLHIAAWAGNAKHIALLLGFSKELQDQIENGELCEIIQAQVRKESKKESNISELVNSKCDFSQANIIVPKDWKDNKIDHNCKEIDKTLPLLQSGWTALHAASSRAQYHCACLLMAAGAEPCSRDLIGRTPLDIAGSAYYSNENISAKNFADLVTILVDANCKNYTLKNRKTVNTPLHTAVELGSLKAVSVLVNAKVPVNWLNRAGLTALHICVRKKLKEHLQVLANHGTNECDDTETIEIRDKDGNTVLHQAIVENWPAGVRVAIEAGANIMAKDNDGESPIHLAAANGNVEILTEILNVATDKNIVDTVNNLRETALFKAVMNGHTDCVKRLLKEGASIRKTLPRQVNVFHVAAEKGFLNVLRVLLDHDYSITRMMVNHLTADDKKGFGPIHFAVINNHAKCVKLLLSRNAYRSLRVSYGFHRGSTPLHIAAINNNVDIAKIIMKNNEETIHTMNDLGWTPLHTASHYGSRDMIILLLEEGADLASLTNGPNNCRTTAIDMIMNNLSKPTDFMEQIFDRYINTNSSLQDANCEVIVDYKILVPNEEAKEQIKVIDALLKTGDRYGQRRLLVHPLLESFLCLKWKALQPFFYTMIALYAFFVMSLTTYIVSVFFYKDTKIDPPIYLNDVVWMVVLYIVVFLIISQEILFMKVNETYFRQLESWVKVCSVCLAVALPTVATRIDLSGTDWPRHVATVALLLSWLEMMFLLSRFPKWGYYVLMFGKVSTNVMKILLTFAFLVIGFSLSFMIQFHSQVPFEHPWAALVKTMVMMTSEFDYEDLMKQTDSEKFVHSLLVVRLIFFVFLILAAIVLMNLLVGVAVNDLHNLQLLGNVRRLGKQVEFLGSLENLVYNKIFMKLMPNCLKEILKKQTKKLKDFVLRPSMPKSKGYRSLPSHIRDAIFEKAQMHKKQLEDEIGTQKDRKKLDEIYEVTVQKFCRKQPNAKNFSVPGNRTRSVPNFSQLAGQVIDLDSSLDDVKNQTTLSIKELKGSIAMLNNKMNLILSKLEKL
ncbi:transient receptor potential channel pyrexia-like [Trichoplusia ni]|uniref:Transient receptor potential channel pyrexia-like n=1 Tax=Trichoplusia ni TaxID=7111 RepID=A0A7E5VHC9_TRINI|nr:transient receptor potential channel pyrexia-like [Trichoplusia ni]